MKLFLSLTLLPWFCLAQSEDPIVTPRAEQVVAHLYQNHSLSEAVFITQKAWQMSQSFASDAQLSEQWQSVLETEVPSLTRFPTIDSHSLLGQMMIMNSPSMSLDDWRITDLDPQPEVDLNAHTLSPTQQFSAYVNLHHHWHALLTQLKHPIDWFVIEGLPDVVDQKAPLDLSQVIQLASSDDAFEPQLTLHPGTLSPLQVALLRQQWHRKQQDPLAFFYDWVQIYQFVEFRTQLFTADEQLAFNQLIEQSQTWWQQQEAPVHQIDRQLFATLQLLFIQLPEKFKNPDHINPNLNRLIIKAQLDLDDPNGYLNHPLRENAQKQLAVCLDISDENPPFPDAPIDSQQFLSCVSEWTQWGAQNARQSTLAGQPMGLDGSLAWHRVLQMPYFQSINYFYHGPANRCNQDSGPIVNPLEWAWAVEALNWFIDRWPGLAASTDLTDQLTQLYEAGNSVFEPSPCHDAAATLTDQYNLLKNKWHQLKQATNSQLAQYRSDHFNNNQTIDLFQSANQDVRMSAEGMVIQPCDTSHACGVFVDLPAHVGLLDLFPDHVRMAHQMGLGTIKLCYDQVGWANRQTEPTHLNNNKIANFTGQLNFELVGQYQEQTVFKKSFTSTNSYTYLFGENSQEVLDLHCPMPIIGTQINTQLDRGTYGLFPNRLTFLTAQRTDISALLRNNWQEGEAWQQQLSHEKQSEYLFFDELNDLKKSVNDAFLNHVNQAQQQIYRKLMYVNTARINDSELSAAVFDYIVQRLRFEKTVIALYPDLYTDPTVRSALKGNQQLMNTAYFSQAFETQKSLIDMLNEGDQILAQYQSLWPEIQSSNLSLYEQSRAQLIDAMQRNQNP